MTQGVPDNQPVKAPVGPDDLIHDAAAPMALKIGDESHVLRLVRGADGKPRLRLCSEFCRLLREELNRIAAGLRAQGDDLAKRDVDDLLKKVVDAETDLASNTPAKSALQHEQELQAALKELGARHGGFDKVAKGRTPAAEALGEAHNAANASKLRQSLAAAESAGTVIESLRTTGRLPSNYVTKGQAVAQGWQPGKALGNSVPGG